jgi:outer membrane protein assembly factor BamB
MRTDRRSGQSVRRGCSTVVSFALAAVLVSATAPVAAATMAGATLWARRYDGPAHADDTAYSVAGSPDGTKVFVTGESMGGSGDYATVAYRASTGAQIWASRYDGPVSGVDIPDDIAVSPDGSEVFVTGSSDARGGTGWATVAYDAASGSTLWVRRHRGGAAAVAPSTDGSLVYVTGGAHDDFATLAYRAGTGATVWASRYDGPAHFDDGAAAISVTPDRVFVTGTSFGSAATFGDYATVALDPASGARIWVRRYNGPGDGYDFPYSIVGSVDGSRVFVTGESLGRTNVDFATIAYEGDSGRRLWTKRLDGGDVDEAFAAATTPDGSSVVVTGVSYHWPATGADFATVAYDGASGSKTWLRRYHGVGAFNDEPLAIASSPDGTTVYVTGLSYQGRTTGEDVTTFAYGVGTGVVRWSAFYVGPGHETDVGWSVAAGPDGSKVFVTGRVGYTQPDYVTIAYAA